MKAASRRTQRPRLAGIAWPPLILHGHDIIASQPAAVCSEPHCSDVVPETVA